MGKKGNPRQEILRQGISFFDLTEKSHKMSEMR